MSKQGIYKISGNTKPKVGELATYRIDEWYPATPMQKRNPALVTWHLFKKVNGKFVPTNIKKVGVSSFTFNTNAYKDTFRVEAYLHSPEERAPMALEVQPQPNDVPKINKVELKYIDDTPGTVFSFTEKLVAEASCMNLEGQYLMFTLWEDDATDSGHNNSNQSIDNKRAKVINGTARAEFMLTKALMRKAMEGEINPQQMEFYVTVEYYAHKKHATNNVNINTPAELRTPAGQPQPQQPAPQPQQPAPPPPQQPQQPQQPTPSPNPTPVPDPVSAHGQAHNTQPTTPPPSGGVSPTTVNPVKIEELLDAYFAKKEYTKQTGEEDGTHTYTFGGSKSGNKTSTAEEKNKVAQTILNKIKDSLKAQKKYTTLEIIAASLTAQAYGKDTANEKTVTFKTFKLGVDFKKVDSAPLDDKLYLVARTMLLEGKQVTISIKEKDGLIKGTPDSLLPVLEITEEQMEQKTPAGQAVPGTEKTVFTGTVKDNIVKIPIHLRPKSEDELKQWKDKISKGKEDGTYTYTFGSTTNITNETQKASIAKVILANAQKGNAKNPKIESGKTSSEEEIKKVLEIKNYSEGNTITFKLLKNVPEFLYLHAKAQGEKQHDKEFLKKEGAYFQIGKKCDCEARVRAFIRMLRVGEGTGEIIKSYDRKQKKIIYIPHDFQRGYTIAFAGNIITDLSTHPQLIYKGKNDKQGSSAAGAYQVMRYTWWELSGFEVVKKKKTGKYFEERDLLKKYKIPDYTPESQDKICIALMQKQREDLLGKIIANKIREAIQQDACYIWASLPETETESHYFYNGSRQPATPLTTCIEHYDQFLQEELKGNTNLHLKEGFLKDFGVKCCNEGEESSGVCPDDRSQCFEYSDVVSSPKLNNQSDNVNKNRWHRTKRYNSTHPNGYYHTGTDILASSGTAVKSMMCGTVSDLVKTFSANEYRENSLGNYIVIKSKDKNGNDVYIKYCHLDEVSVSKNQKVKHGDTIGKSGSTGNAASVYKDGKLIHGINPIYRHIHIEAATSSSFGATRIDPEQFMKTKFDETTKGNPK